MSLIIADITKHLIRVFNNRRKFTVTDRADPVTHIRDFIRVCDDNLFRFLRTQIFKFLQHLFCGPQIQRCLIIRIAESLSGHDDSPVDFILGINKMYITGGNHRFFKLFSQFHDPSVQIPKIFLGGYIIPVFIPHHKHVVTDRLDLQIIIEFHQTGDL